MISDPGFRFWHPEDGVTWQRVRPGTARRIWPYLRQHRGPMVLLLGITAVDSAILAVSPLILRLIIDDGILRHRESVVVALALTVAGLALVDAGARYAKSWYSQWIGESLVLELRASVFRNMQRQSLAFFTRTQTGSLVSRLDGDINETQRLVGVLLSESVSVLLNLVLVLAAMFWLSWQLSLVALAVIPLFVLPGKVAARRAQRLFRQEWQLHGELAAMTAERSDVSGALLAKLYGRPDEEAGVFTRKATRIRDLAVANAAGMQLVIAFITLLAALVTVLVYGLGGTLVIHGVFGVGTLVAFIALVSELYGPLSDVSHLPLEILTALVSFDRVFEILDLEPLITERPAAYPLPGADGAPGVAVEGVWFRYPEADQVSVASLEPVALPAPECPGNAWVLRDVTFRAPAGRLTALVGPSGAGKTTITHLVPRLYDPVRGAVRIGGSDVRDLTLESLRSVVGVVPQDAHLFHDTIRANLLYARPSATERELVEACEAARIWELISSLPDGLDTFAGDRGYRFSGGEKQRLALARLLLKAPSVVVLDEATAHLDSESEVAIQRALATALAGRTSLVIAHRLSTVRAADQILVVDGGQIAERGTHDELLAAGGVYAGLYRTQFAQQAALRPFTGREPARDAYRDFGKGSGHKAGLNFGDCFAYALAKSTGEALLFKGNDFDLMGALDGEQLHGLRLQADVDGWQAMIDVNLRGVLYAIAAALPVFRRQGRGHLVSTVSTARRVSRSPASGGHVAFHRRFGPSSSNRSIRLSVTRPSAVAVTETITRGRVMPSRPARWSVGMAGR